ncbi:methyltransferase domain-containing protein, partial [Enterococcus faecium]|uniref:methyltransferase domain-containing protein n=1 Tax=Enterococcus faecium TaxID=1352 RepID=UPI003CC5EEE6
FSRVPKKGMFVDVCAGNGAVGVFLSKRTQGAIDAIELQPRLADMARRSFALNHLNEQMTVHTIDLKDSLSVVRHNSCDLVVCKTPYFKG